MENLIEVLGQESEEYEGLLALSQKKMRIIALLHKNLPDCIRRRRLFVRRLYDTLAFAMFVVRMDWKSAGAVLRAHRDFRKMRSKYTTRPHDNLLSGHNNIIADYYLHRKKKYSDL